MPAKRQMVQVSGIKETEEALKHLGTTMRGPKVSIALKAGTDVLRMGLAHASPRGPTGNLRRSWLSYAEKKRVGASRLSVTGIVSSVLGKRAPAAFMLGLTRKAPHLHLVVYGTKDRRRPKKSGVLSFRTTGGSLVFARSVARMPKNAFFWRTVGVLKPQMMAAAENALRKLVEATRREAEAKTRTPDYSEFYTRQRTITARSLAGRKP